METENGRLRSLLETQLLLSRKGDKTLGLVLINLYSMADCPEALKLLRCASRSTPDEVCAEYSEFFPRSNLWKVKEILKDSYGSEFNDYRHAVTGKLKDIFRGAPTEAEVMGSFNSLLDSVPSSIEG